MIALYIYLAICAVIAVYFIARFGYEDLTGKYDKKFGPNYKSGFSWILLFVASCPLVNFVVLYIFAVSVKEGIKKTMEQRRGNSV
jgi:hypothetical protein